MNNTGIIKNGLHADIQNIIFGHDIDSAIDNYLTYVCCIDKAHLINLTESELIDKTTASLILNEINHLVKEDFASLRKANNMQRGAYILYEDYLISKLGIDIAGYLQYGRSRNDLNATVFLLRLRKYYVLLIDKLIVFCEQVIDKAEIYQKTIMPAYTHYQPAVPITYGHWLLGLATYLIRSITHIYYLAKDMQTCPLGAGAIGGTTLPINASKSAKLLGFEKSNNNSIDAVANRDIVLRILSECNIICSCISRISQQLLLFTSQEFDFFSIPDELIGGSSMMPNKRNPFVLEQIIGKCGRIYGYYTSSISAMHASLYSNSISVGTEATADVWTSINMCTDVLTLIDLFIGKIVPKTENMIHSAEQGNIIATEVANHLVKYKGYSFRKAHKYVGEMVYESLYKNKPLDNQLKELFDNKFSLEDIITNSEFGGGAGKLNFENQKTWLMSELHMYKSNIQSLSKLWQDSMDKLQNQFFL